MISSSRLRAQSFRRCEIDCAPALNRPPPQRNTPLLGFCPRRCLNRSRSISRCAPLPACSSCVARSRGIAWTRHSAAGSSAWSKSGGRDKQPEFLQYLLTGCIPTGPGHCQRPPLGVGHLPAQPRALRPPEGSRRAPRPAPLSCSRRRPTSAARIARSGPWRHPPRLLLPAVPIWTQGRSICHRHAPLPSRFLLLRRRWCKSPSPQDPLLQRLRL